MGIVSRHATLTVWLTYQPCCASTNFEATRADSRLAGNPSHGMVRIIGGEVVQDDDPRLAARPAAPRAPAQPEAPTRSGQDRRTAPAREGVGFDWSAAPVRLLQREGGLPDVEVYGVRMPTAGLLAIAGASIAFGWRGLLGAGIIYYLYLIRPQNGPAGQQDGQGPHQQAGGGLQQLFQQGAAALNFGTEGGGGAASEGRAARARAPSQQQAGTSESSSRSGAGAFSGKAYKLSGD